MWGIVLKFAAPVIGPLLGSTKGKIALIGILGAALACGGAWWRKLNNDRKFENLNETVSQLEANNETLKANATRYEDALESERASLRSFQEQYDILREQNRKLLEDNREAERYGDELTALLARHDLEYLAYKKPGLVEKRMNDATVKVFSDIERITSSD